MNKYFDKMSQLGDIKYIKKMTLDNILLHRKEGLKISGMIFELEDQDIKKF